MPPEASGERLPQRRQFAAQPAARQPSSPLNQYWDGAAGRDRYAREYVPRSELPRVRRWIRRARAETALGWGQAGLCSNRGTDVLRGGAAKVITSAIDAARWASQCW
jgi:hypothetical protein